ncbi:LptF/LptG family permease [filamentous cyanobacterium LEGE 11480]|uniref:LptF/LptG family permease n=1 Tax=Romeriopsis navalis LEGE 11480 TaxID=2777977 RepID=A0A928VR98_9CYAN|nr:LptF/LptG family permease [Romeriopsis navalis]MBE9032292.1 LptF/LptG family permease [Romeriopsis navalis LEGE 11480]
MSATLKQKPALSVWNPFRVSVLDRYLLKQLLLPFLFGVAAFSSIGVSVGALFDLIRKITTVNLPFEIALQVFFLQIPLYISYALPMSTLLATLMMYSRLSTDSELIALRSAGMSLYRLIMPAVFLSLMITLTSFAFNEAIVPAANYRATTTLETALKADTKKFQEENILSSEYAEVKGEDGKTKRVLSRIFYASEFNGDSLSGLTVLDFSQTGLTQIISADAAKWEVAKGRWKFSDGTIYVVSPDGSYRNIFKFAEQEIQLPRTPLDLANRKQDWMEMNIAELQEALALANSTGDEKQAYKMRLRIQQKLAIPFICLVFGVIGSTLGMRPQRSGKGTSFAISILIIFGYYLVSFICDSLGLLAIFSPIMAAWIPTFLGLGLGGLLLSRASR